MVSIRFCSPLKQNKSKKSFLECDTYTTNYQNVEIMEARIKIARMLRGLPRLVQNDL